MVHLGRLKLLIRPTETCHEMKQQTGRCPKSAAVTCDSKKKRRWHAVGCNRVSLLHKPFGVCVAMSATKHGEFQTTTTHVMQLFTVLLGGGGKGRKREKQKGKLVHLGLKGCKIEWGCVTDRDVSAPRESKTPAGSAAKSLSRRPLVTPNQPKSM